MVVGTWFAAIATIAAVAVALWLSRRSEEVRLKAYAGLRDIIRGDGTPAETHLIISVTNLSERPVTITSVGWAVGKRKRQRFAVQTMSGRFTHQYPVELAHGKTADFTVSFVATPDWPKDFASGFIKDLSDRHLKTLIALIQTSVGQMVKVRPEPELLQALKNAGASDRTGEAE